MIRLTESGECDEAGDHEDRVQVELQFGIIAPSESTAVINDPENGEDERADEQNCREDNNQEVFEPGSAAPGIF